MGKEEEMTCVFDSYKLDGNDFDYISAWKEKTTCMVCKEKMPCIRFQDQHEKSKACICLRCFNNFWEEDKCD